MFLFSMYKELADLIC